MKKNVWQLQEAKNKFSMVVQRAQKEGPQIVTKHGREAVVVLAYDEYRKFLEPKDDIVEFLRNSPLRDVDLDDVRSKDFPREIEL